MQIMKISSVNHAPSFNRRLRENENKEYRTDTIQQAYDYLGIKEVAMIMHGSCYPAGKYDFGIGSPVGKSAEGMAKFEMLHGVTGVQQGPLGEISRADVSPYTSTVFAKNHMFIDAGELLNDAYANILDKATLEKYIEPEDKSGNNYAYSKFYDAFDNYDTLIHTAHKNFKTKLKDGDKKAEALNQEYQTFKSSNSPRVIKEGLFTVLSDKYGTKEFKNWENPIDRRLPQLLDKNDPEATARYKDILKRSGNKLDEYCFAQFLVDKQIKDNKAFRKEATTKLDFMPESQANKGFVHINDQLICFSPMDEYINEEAFIPKMRIGCPDGGPDGGPQMWDGAVLAPDKMFNTDGSLGVAGKLLKEKVDSMLESCENVRIDHAMGLVDPYIYDETTIEYIDGKLNRNKFHGGSLSQLNIDTDGSYKKILEKIVLPSMEAHGLNPEDALWEYINYADNKTAFDEVLYKGKTLPGLTQLEFKKSEGSSRKNWALLGSHDSLPALRFLNIESWARDHEAWQPQYLAGFLHWDKDRAKERDAFCDKVAVDNLARVKAKFAELFMNSEKIQIAFADFFGINEVYNFKGANVNTNWKLRLNKDYEDAYYKNLSSDNSTALNLPEILECAVKAQMDREYIERMNDKKAEIKGSSDYDNKLKDVENESLDYRSKLQEKMKPLLDRLDKYKNILKEKEE